MTKAQAAELQVKWKQQDPPRLCEHPKIDIERNEDGYVTGNYRCRECGEAIVRTYKPQTSPGYPSID
jgi:formylmethanofuran dehydrogenase subunit E